MENLDPKQEFDGGIIANTLHEIRTPIQTIIGTLELLSETSLNEEQVEYIHQIQFGADILLSMADDVLDLSKIRSGNFKLESISYNVHSLVEHVTDLVCIEAFNKGLEVVTDIAEDVPVTVIGDPTRVQQILLNLLKNAVKFTGEGHVLCRLSVLKQNLMFEVFDTGMGITKEARKKLFTSFFQADASIARKYGGTGLGLSICKTLVAAMNGTIGVSKNKPKGTRFWFSIPLKLPHARKAKHRAAIKDSRTKILIVDNNKTACKSILNKIVQCGFSAENIFTVNSGKSALSALKKAVKEKKPFSIALIDMIMPKMDGWYLASEIRTRNLCLNTKLYMLSPEGQMGGEAKMKLLNWFNGYLYKPVKQAKLYQILQDAVGFHRSAEAQKESDINSGERQEIQEQVAHGLSVLVVEDHPVNRKLISTFLQKLGVEVLEASDGSEAVEMIKQNPETDMVFMDILMANKNGIEATDEIRAMDYRGIVIACTANNDFASVDEYEKHGINDTLIKPFKSSDIKKMLLKWQDFRILPAEPIPEDA
ncbi:response regulator [Treponema parvum]|uniref:histidine kinase n=1 Tax=Treponema parvum TaxID=138851 RepID=A0A975IFD9_9SPIR|nr:response regulator [Treponema parvum]QTQ14772.1 response regulator [Treponema parvum]